MRGPEYESKEVRPQSPGKGVPREAQGRGGNMPTFSGGRCLPAPMAPQGWEVRLGDLLQNTDGNLLL